MLNGVRKTLRLEFALRALGVAAILFSPACSDLGFQGGVIPSNFGGLKTIDAISPESFQLAWDAYPGASSYRVFIPDQNDPVAQPSFTTLITPPRGNPSESGEYRFSVVAVDPLTGSTKGERSNYLSARLLPRFDFVKSGSVVALPASPPTRVALRVSWQANPTVSYRVYLAEREPTGNIQYNFVASSAAVTGLGYADLEGLNPGREYCAIVLANYIDGTTDRPDAVKLEGPIANLMKGPTNAFGDSVVAKSQKCARTLASQSFGALVNGTTVYSPKAGLSNQPSFYVQMGSDTIDDNAGAQARTTIYSMDPTTGLGSYLGTTIGTGKITSNISLPAGKYKFFAMIGDLNSTAQAKKEIVVGIGSTNPLPEAQRPWVYVRGLKDTASDPTHYPEKLQGGAGSISIGTAVALGDFNCDGRKDIAVSADNLTIMLNDNRPAKTGLVKVYFDVSQLSSVSAQTRSQHIYFDISDQFPNGRDLGLGTRLFSMNINGDKQNTNQRPALQSEVDLLKPKFDCDDLVISSTYGPMFVLYGKRDVGGPNGGLNYLGPKSYVMNPTSACTVEGICQPSMYAFSNNVTIPLGRAFAQGDFDGDGFPDLAVASNTNTGIWVFRGSEYGLISPKPYEDTREKIVTDSGPGRESFPYLPGDSTAHAALYAPGATGAAITSPISVDGWGTGDFGTALASLRNGYFDAATSRVRDVLFVSSPSANMGKGRVFACLPKTIPGTGKGNTFAEDSGRNIGWDCNHYIDPPTQSASDRDNLASSSALTVARFGSAMATLVNPLRYRLDNLNVTDCGNLPGGIGPLPYAFGNCTDTTTNTKMGVPGGIAVGASGTNQVFVYYGVHLPSAAGSRATLGSARNSDFDNRIAPTGSSSAPEYLTAVRNEPCTGVSAGTETCHVQILTQTSPGGGFGSVMTALPGNNSGNNGDSPKETMLAVGAPDRDITLSQVKYLSVGDVLIFQQRSNWSSDPIEIGPTASAISRFSTGFSTTLTTTVNYDGPMNPQVRFGSSIAGGPLLSTADASDYLPSTDLVIGAPGHVKTKDSAGASIVPVYGNGAALVFFSNAGTLRTYIPGAPSTPASPWHILDGMVSSDGAATPVGQESDSRFHLALSPGDMNGDGIDDVVVRMAQGRNRNSLRVYYSNECNDLTGVTCSAGLKKSPNSYDTFNVSGEITGGARFVPGGRLTGGNNGSLFITAMEHSFLYFFGSAGIIPGVPAEFNSPRKFTTVPGGTQALDMNGAPSGAGYLPFRDRTFFNWEGSPATRQGSHLAHNAFAFGDFNGDGYGDFAYGLTDTTTEGSGVVDLRAIATCPTTTSGPRRCLSSSAALTADRVGRGRVIIWYGGAFNGPQAQADARKGYPLQTSYKGDDLATYGFSTLSGTLTAQSTFSTEPPCSLSNGSYRCNRIQLIAEQGTASFGSTLTSIPLGTCNGKPVHGLAVRAIRNDANDGSGTNQSSDVYVYRPKCVEPNESTTLTGLVYGGIIRGTSSTGQPNLGIGTSTTLGMGMAASGGIMGNDTPTNPTTLHSHLVLSDPTSRKLFVVPFLQNATTYANTGFAYPGETDFVTFKGRSENYNSSMFLSGSLTGADVGFGETIANLGDVNADGFEDIGVNVSKLNRNETNTSFPQQGAILVLFGSHDGLQTRNAGNSLINPVTNADCYLKKGMVNSIERIVSVCNPTLLFAPQPAGSIRQGAYEMSFLSPFSRISTGTRNVSTGACMAPNSPNECLGSFLFGTSGRDGPGGSGSNILQGGGFYYVP